MTERPASNTDRGRGSPGAADAPDRAEQPIGPPEVDRRRGAGHVTLDAWMAEHPWHPRVVPFVVYVGFLPVVGTLRHWEPRLYALGYAVQCGSVAWLLWKYRRHLPELTVTFHWAAVPVGVAVFAAWVWLGRWVGTSGLLGGDAAGHEPMNFIAAMGPVIGWTAMSMRLAGMSLLVPLFEELFVRSLLLRSFHRFRPSVHGLIHLLMDLPLLGDWMYQTEWGDRVGHGGPVFGPEFERTSLGALSVWGVTVSTVVFTIHHVPRDWAGCVVCALAYCFLLSATRKRGLGPVCWAHGITNALLWGYTVYTGDWQFL